MSPSRQEFAYDQIRERVLDGSYGPGFKLTISTLAREFGSSPIPVREALRRLEAEGLIEYTHNSGPVVTRATGKAYIETLETLAAMEGYALMISAPHIGAPTLAALRATNQRMADALINVDPDEFGRLNREFHFLVYEQCPNNYLVECLRTAWNRLENVRRTTLVLLPGRGPSSVREHAEIIDAIEQKLPPAKLEALGRQHKLQTIESFHLWQAQKTGGRPVKELQK